MTVHPTATVLHAIIDVQFVDDHGDERRHDEHTDEEARLGQVNASKDVALPHAVGDEAIFDEPPAGGAASAEAPLRAPVR